MVGACPSSGARCGRHVVLGCLVVAAVVWATVIVAAPALADAASPAVTSPAAAAVAADAAGVASTPTEPARSGLEQVLRAAFAASAFSAIGVLFFLLTAWDGSRPEFDLLCRVMERAAIVAAVVAAAQLGARAALMAGGVSDAVRLLPAVLTGAYGAGMILRAAGSAVLFAGASMLRRTSTSTWAAILGASLIVGSFALAGYAADAEPRVVSSFAIVAHVAAAAAWGGGLLALVITLTHRSRAGRPLRAGYVAARFSVLATFAVALAAVAGLALTVVRLDSVTELWTTAYGLTLVAKVILVALVGAIGTYNHFVVVPVLRTTPDHAYGRRLRWLGSLEVALFALVVGINSSLVGLAG